METIHRGGQPTYGFGVGGSAQGIIVQPIGKVGAFISSATMCGVAGMVATALFGEGPHPVERLRRGWPVLAATAAAGGLAGAIIAP